MRQTCVLLCYQSLLEADDEQCDSDEDFGGCNDEESLRCSAESLLCDELMWLSDDDSNCCPR